MDTPKGVPKINPFGEANMKRAFCFLAALAMLFVLVGLDAGTAHAQKKPVVLRLVVPAPAGDWPLTWINDEFAKRFNERAKGEYKIEVFAGGALAKLPEYFDAVRVGAVEIACAPWGLFTSLDRRLGALETPFLFASSPGASSACKALLPLHDKILQEKFNAKALGLFNTGTVNIYAMKPVKTLQDWKGLLTGCISPVASTLAKDMGASAVTIMWTDLYESLQKKVIDATLMGTHGGVVMNTIDVCKNVALFAGVIGFNGWSINLDVWKKMPPGVQKMLSEEAEAAAERINKAVDSEVGEYDMKKFKEKGVNPYFVPKAERGRWEAKLASYKEKTIGSLGEFGQQVKKIADEANKKYPYTERGTY
jgi:TRAP-type C4-dicarboxylate transport system substrate-binding protein